MLWQAMARDFVKCYVIVKYKHAITNLCEGKMLNSYDHRKWNHAMTLVKCVIIFPKNDMKYSSD